MRLAERLIAVSMCRVYAADAEMRGMCNDVPNETRELLWRALRAVYGPIVSSPRQAISEHEGILALYLAAEVLSE